MLQTDKVLKEKRKQFVRSVGAGTINGLLDELLEKKVLNQEEMQRIRDGNATVMDKARLLIDSVVWKGPEASQILVSQICEDDSYLAKMLGLSSGKINNSDSIKFTRPCVLYLHWLFQFADNFLASGIRTPLLCQWLHCLSRFLFSSWFFGLTSLLLIKTHLPS